jgi:signal transduction histidine kinase
MLAGELRNLLTPIRFAMLTIRRQAEHDSAVQRARDVVDRRVEYLSRLLDDLLDVSRLGRGKVDLQKESLTLQTIVTAALETTLGLADARRHQVSVSLPEEPLLLEGTPPGSRRSSPTCSPTPRSSHHLAARSR